MRRFVKFILSSICFILIQQCHVKAQTAINDSIKHRINSSANLSDQLHDIILLTSRSYALSLDTFYHYIVSGRQIALPGSTEYFRLENAYVRYLSKRDYSEKALNLVDSLLNIIPQTEKFYDARQWLINNKAAIFIRTNKQKEAIELELKVLKDAEGASDAMWICRAYVGLGWANLELGKYDDAIKWLTTGYLNTPDSLLSRNSFLFSNLASCYNNINQSDSAFKYIELALKYGSLDQNLTQLANSYSIRADMYINAKEHQLAEKDLEEAIKIRQKIGDNLYVIADMAQLSFFYASIGETDKGIAIANKAITIAEELKSVSKQIFIYNALAENYKAAGLYQKYASVLEKVMALKDTLSDQNSTEAIARFEARYELQKKENIIMQQQLKITRSRYITIGSLLLLTLIALTLGLWYRNRQLLNNRKMEMDLLEQKVQSKIAVKQAQENERKRIAADLHDNLGVYAAAITHNVNQLREQFANNGVITENLEANAQNMVSQLNNTIWVLKNDDLRLTQLSDRLKLWMQRLMKNYPAIKYSFSEKIINDNTYTPAVMLNLYYILMECVNNSLKHSGCTEINILFNSQIRTVIEVVDNGKGMSEPVKSGNGLIHIKQRAEESQWLVAWVVGDSGGTKVILTDTTK